MSLSGTEGPIPRNEEALLTLHERALRAATEFAHDVGLTRPLHPLRIRGSSSWVYGDGQSGSGSVEPSVAVRLATAEEPDVLLKNTVHDVSLVQEFHSLGAPVQEFIDKPRLHDDFVVTMSTYLPTSWGSLWAYGGAVAVMRNISEENPQLVERAYSFNPLAEMRSTFEYLKEHKVIGVSEQFLEQIFLVQLQRGEEAVQEMLQLRNHAGLPLVIAPHDITLSNARRDKDGVTRLLDLYGLMAMPAEFALARPLGQWHTNFNRPKAWSSDIRGGYEQLAKRPLNSEILDLAIEVSKIKYAASPLNQMVDSLKQDDIPNGWAIHEGTRRLSNGMNSPWVSQDDFLRGVASRIGAAFSVDSR